MPTTLRRGDRGGHGLQRRLRHGFPAWCLAWVFLVVSGLASDTPTPPQSPGAFPVYDPGIQIDPMLAYYRGVSPEGIAAEIQATGYRVARYILTADSLVQTNLVEALHREGIGVWYATFCNGAYTTRDLPAGWEAWQMVTRSDLQGKPWRDGYTRLCLNHPGYRAWKKAQITRMLTRHAFQGVDLMEPHWPEYPGVASPAYACFCPQCVKAFRELYPGEEALPDVVDANSPRSPARNPALWARWLTFRHRSLTAFLNDLVNGENGIRAAAPQAAVCVWILGLSETNGLQRVLEDSGEDPREIALTVKPDMFCIQTHWPDWTRADLPPAYVEHYRPFIDALRAASPRMRILLQADTGSQPQNRRSWAWVRDFERASLAQGATTTAFYEYSLGEYIYSDPPRLVAARRTGPRIELRFTKRLDPAVAREPGHYRLASGAVTQVEVDGSRVLLATEGLAPGSTNAITVRGLKDDVSRRLYKDRPATILEEQTLPLATPE